jgi:hypothetical protein
VQWKSVEQGANDLFLTPFLGLSPLSQEAALILSYRCWIMTNREGASSSAGAVVTAVPNSTCTREKSLEGAAG